MFWPVLQYGSRETRLIMSVGKFAVGALDFRDRLSFPSVSRQVVPRDKTLTCGSQCRSYASIMRSRTRPARQTRNTRSITVAACIYI